MWVSGGLNNESDVEQKFLYPILTSPTPVGLGLPPEVIQTKTNIRRLDIDKGASRKSYFPDYLVVSMGFPLVVIEAKSPSEALEEGFREARLYAQEINALFAHNVAPVQLVVASNGVALWFGHVDQAKPIATIECTALNPYSPEFAQLAELASWDRLRARTTKLAQDVRPAELFKPRRLLGGLAFQNEEVGQNSFGATLTSAISSVFNPSSRGERARVARDAYVPSKRRSRYVDPIDKVIRAARPPSEKYATEIEDTSRPRELIGKLRQPRELEHKVLLIVGSVGAGKSTFIDHLTEVALPRELMEQTVWCRINMNTAPVTASEIYPWLRREIIRGCQQSLPELDFDELTVLKRVFGTDIQRFSKGVGKLYEAQPEVYSLKLAEHLERLQSDEQKTADAHVRFCCAERGKLFVVVLDNCDKKTRDEQLLMFETAQWLQKEFRCLVILPMRDETYDNHRDQPPLDTALKDLVFRIEPPMFQHVLFRRVQLALKTLGGDDGEKLHFDLPNGFVVEYQRSDQAYYLTSIIKSLFEYDRFARRLIVGLSGRNMRRALEIFLEFCNSGHIGEDQIFKIRQSQGRHVLPFHQVATVLLRMNRRFYDSDHSYIKNLFAADKDDSLPSYFCRYMILRWLRLRFNSAGSSGLKGYHQKRAIKRDLLPHGLDPTVVDRELQYLVAAQCVIAEHLRVDALADDDLVRLGPAGFAHLDLIGNVDYLAAVAEDTLFPDRITAERVAERIRNPQQQLRRATTAGNAEELVNLLESSRGALEPENGAYMAGSELKQLTDLTEARDTLTRIAKSNADDPWFAAERQLRRNSVHEATIVNVRDFGAFAEFDTGVVGLIHRSNYGALTTSPGDRVKVQVLWVDSVQRRMGLRLIEILEEEVGDRLPRV